MTERNNNSYMNYNELVQQYMRLTNGIQQNLRLASNMYDRIEQHTYSLLNNEMRYDLRRIVYNNNTNNNRESTENSSDERTREEVEFEEMLTNLFSRRNNHSNPPANNRFGNLNTGDQIVLAASASLHRKAAFESTEFIMDYLKTSAPFWKSENLNNKNIWVDSKPADLLAAKKWVK